MWNAEKAVLTGEFIALGAHIRKEDRTKTSHLNVHLKKLEKQYNLKQAEYR